MSRTIYAEPKRKDSTGILGKGRVISIGGKIWLAGSPGVDIGCVSSYYLRESDQNMLLKTARLEPTGVTSCKQVGRYLYLEISDQKQGRRLVLLPYHARVLAFRVVGLPRIISDCSWWLVLEYARTQLYDA